MYENGMMVLQFIDENYYGGIQQFLDNNGNVLPFPDGKGIFINFPPKEDTRDLKESIQEHAQENKDFEIIFIDQINTDFEESCLERFRLSLMEISPIVAIMLSPIAVCVTLPVTYYDDMYSKISKIIKRHLPNAYRIIIAFSDTHKIFINDDLTSTKSNPQIIVKSDRPQRDKNFSDDDLINLKIALETNVDVLKLIDQL
jgi:hypothetical protein